MWHLLYYQAVEPLFFPEMCLELQWKALKSGSAFLLEMRILSAAIQFSSCFSWEKEKEESSKVFVKFWLWSAQLNENQLNLQALQPRAQKECEAATSIKITMGHKISLLYIGPNSGETMPAFNLDNFLHPPHPTPPKKAHTGDIESWNEKENYAAWGMWKFVVQLS